MFKFTFSSYLYFKNWSDNLLHLPSYLHLLFLYSLLEEGCFYSAAEFPFNPPACFYKLSFTYKASNLHFAFVGFSLAFCPSSTLHSCVWFPSSESFLLSFFFFFLVYIWFLLVCTFSQIFCFHFSAKLFWICVSGCSRFLKEKITSLRFAAFRASAAFGQYYKWNTQLQL